MAPGPAQDRLGRSHKAHVDVVLRFTFAMNRALSADAGCKQLQRLRCVPTPDAPTDVSHRCGLCATVSEPLATRRLKAHSSRLSLGFVCCPSHFPESHPAFGTTSSPVPCGCSAQAQRPCLSLLVTTFPVGGVPGSSSWNAPRRGLSDGLLTVGWT